MTRRSGYDISKAEELETWIVEVLDGRDEMPYLYAESLSLQRQGAYDKLSYDEKARRLDRIMRGLTRVHEMGKLLRRIARDNPEVI